MSRRCSGCSRLTGPKSGVHASACVLVHSEEWVNVVSHLVVVSANLMEIHNIDCERSCFNGNRADKPGN